MPRGFKVPQVQEAASVLAPGTGRLVSYHQATEGRALVCFEEGDQIRIAAGDIVVLPHGRAHSVSNGSPSSFVDSSAAPSEALSAHPRTIRIGTGADAKTTIVCGYLGCDRQADRLFLAGLPAVFEMNLRGGTSGSRLESSVRYLVGEAQSRRPGAAVRLSKMAEASFVEALRRYMDELSPGQTGWLAGARDPIVGGALALMHDGPRRRWNVPRLAREAGTSRSVLGERSLRFLGDPPLTYLARWRLQFSARSLEDTDKTVLEVATEVGYQSESAFNRAFKREFGLPPARYRKRRRANEQ